MKNLSRFDIAIIIAFVIITLLGVGGWYYLSGQLAATKDQVASAATDFDRYSKNQPYLPTQANEKVLKDNISLIQEQLDPLIKTRLEASGNKLSTVVKEDTVAWKHDLDAEVARLSLLAHQHNVVVPPNFYYGFSRYLNQNPSDEQTVVLGKQLLGVEELANIFINATVHSISTFRRTFEEDAGSGNSSAPPNRADADYLPGYSVSAPGDVYVAYPFEIEFETSTTNLRKVIGDLQKSPYVFVIRSITLRNSSPGSPLVSDLEKIAGSPNSGVIDSSPGSVSDAPKPARGPQFLFGNETLRVKMRVDMIEWIGPAQKKETR